MTLKNIVCTLSYPDLSLCISRRVVFNCNPGKRKASASSLLTKNHTKKPASAITEAGKSYSKN